MSAKPSSENSRPGMDISRRDMLLAGTALAAAAFSTPPGVSRAHAQVSQPAAAGDTPNILVIFGDDNGTFNNGVKNARGKFFYCDDDGLLVGFRQATPICLLGAAFARHHGGMGGAFHDIAPAEDIQPVPVSVRAGRHHVQHLLGLAVNHVQLMYGVRDEIFRFVETFQEFSPRSFRPSFNPAKIMESTLDGMKQREALKRSLDLERVRSGLNRMIDEALQHRAVQ